MDLGDALRQLTQLTQLTQLIILTIWLTTNDLSGDRFQENLLKTMLAIENVFFDLAKTCGRDCLVICDRGAMDAAAYMERAAFNEILKRNNLNNVELRDNRYNQVIHLMTAAKGAEAFYQIEDNPVRSEGIELARKLDSLTIESWIGHPYIDVIDNNVASFDSKMAAMIEVGVWFTLSMEWLASSSISMSFDYLDPDPQNDREENQPK